MDPDQIVPTSHVCVQNVFLNGQGVEMEPKSRNQEPKDATCGCGSSCGLNCDSNHGCNHESLLQSRKEAEDELERLKIKKQEVEEKKLRLINEIEFKKRIVGKIESLQVKLSQLEQDLQNEKILQDRMLFGDVKQSISVKVTRSNCCRKCRRSGFRH